MKLFALILSVLILPVPLGLGSIKLAGVLSNKSTQPLIQELARSIVFPYGRINFVGGGGSNDRDVVFILWGDRADVSRFGAELGGMLVEVRKYATSR